MKQILLFILLIGFVSCTNDAPIDHFKIAIDQDYISYEENNFDEIKLLSSDRVDLNAISLIQHRYEKNLYQIPHDEFEKVNGGIQLRAFDSIRMKYLELLTNKYDYSNLSIEDKNEIQAYFDKSEIGKKLIRDLIIEY